MFLRKIGAGAFLTCASLSFVLSTDTDLGHSMQLFVKNNSRGYTHTFDVRTNHTIRIIADLCAEKERVDKEAVSLIFSGKSLSDPQNIDKTLRHFNIQRESTIHLVLRPKATAGEDGTEGQPIPANQAGLPASDNKDEIDPDDCLKTDSNTLDELDVKNQKRLNNRCIDAANTFDQNMLELGRTYQNNIPRINWNTVDKDNWIYDKKWSEEDRKRHENHPILKNIHELQTQIQLLDSSLDESIGSQRADQKNREQVMKIIGPKLGFKWENLFYDYISKLSNNSEKSDISKIIDGLSLSATDRVSVNSFVKMGSIHFGIMPPSIDIVKKVLTNKAITKYLVLMAARYGESHNAFFDKDAEDKLDVLSKAFFEGKSLSTVKTEYWNRRVKKTMAGTGGAFDGPGHSLAGFDYRSSNGGFIGFDDHN